MFWCMICISQEKVKIKINLIDDNNSMLQDLKKKNNFHNLRAYVLSRHACGLKKYSP